jgi:hypothetical protein
VLLFLAPVCKCNVQCAMCNADEDVVVRCDLLLFDKKLPANVIMIYTTFRLLTFNSSPSSILSAAARSYYTSVKASTVTTAIPILSPGGIVEKTARRTKFKMANQSNSEQKSVLRRVINSPKAPAAIGPYRYLYHTYSSFL